MPGGDLSFAPKLPVAIVTKQSDSVTNSTAEPVIVTEFSNYMTNTQVTHTIVTNRTDSVTNNLVL
jgi:hypothetical protein